MRQSNLYGRRWHMCYCYRLPKTFQRDLSGLFESFPWTFFPVLVLINTLFTVQRTAENQGGNMGTSKNKVALTMKKLQLQPGRKNNRLNENWKCYFVREIKLLYIWSVAKNRTVQMREEWKTVSEIVNRIKFYMSNFAQLYLNGFLFCINLKY